MGEVTIAAAAVDDAEPILQLLRDCRLPVDGLREHLATALVARDGANLVGCAALEVYADGALLRSVAVADAARGRGVGRRLTDEALALADRLGTPAVFLLTTTAERYFPRVGFVTIARDEVPEGVRQSVEFRGACPASATVMRRAGVRAR